MLTMVTRLSNWITTTTTSSAPSWLRYGQSQNGWSDYVVGNAFQNTLYGIYGMHLTTQTLSVDDIDANGFGLGDAYPKPSWSF